MKSVLFLSFAILLGALGCQADKNSPTSPLVKTQEKIQNERSQYPAHWWKEVPREEAKTWEILPQDAGLGEVVLSKRNELGLLSNFSDRSFVFHGKCYSTVEGYWQMMKYPETSDDPRWKWARQWKYTRDQVAEMNGYSAKSAGNYANFLMDKNDANFVSFEGEFFTFATSQPEKHYALIYAALVEKIRQNKDVYNILMQTGDLVLKPDHGISERSPREWHYNLLWMDIREDIKAGRLSLESSEDLSLKTCKSIRY